MAWREGGREGGGREGGREGEQGSALGPCWAQAARISLRCLLRVGRPGSCVWFGLLSVSLLLLPFTFFLFSCFDFWLLFLYRACSFRLCLAFL